MILALVAEMPICHRHAHLLQTCPSSLNRLRESKADVIDQDCCITDCICISRLVSGIDSTCCARAVCVHLMLTLGIFVLFLFQKFKISIDEHGCDNINITLTTWTIIRWRHRCNLLWRGDVIKMNSELRDCWMQCSNRYIRFLFWWVYN
jgi:hypothetical protein